MSSKALIASRVILAGLLAYQTVKLAKRPAVKTLLTKLLLVYPVRAMLPAVWAIVMARWYRLAQVDRASSIAAVLNVIIRRLARVYISVEAVFFILYLYEKWRLERRIASPPWDPAETGLTRKQFLVKVLDSLQQVNADTCDQVHTSTPLFRSSQDLSQHSPSSSSIQRDKSIGANLVLSSSRTFRERRADSFLRDFQDQTEEWAGDEEVAMLVLRRSVFTSWFNTADLELYRRGNLDSFLCEAFFEGRLVAELELNEKTELAELSDYASDWMGVNLKDGFNAKVGHISLRNDPLPARYRPLLVYLGTHVIVPHLTTGLLSAMGFNRLNSGSLGYWHKKAQSIAQPIIFAHGLGVGVLPYMQFIRDLCGLFPDREVFIVDLPFIAMRPTVLPSSREVAVCVEDMLRIHGHRKAHIVGHSYGTAFLAWLMRRATHLVASVSFLDPICFLLLKPDLAINTLYPKHETPLSAVFSYWVTGELYIAHTLTRNFRWQDNTVWPEDLKVPSLVALSADDYLVPALSVRYHIEREIRKRERGSRPQDVSLSTNSPLDLLWVEDAFHGQFLVDGVVREKILCAVRGTIQKASTLAVG